MTLFAIISAASNQLRRCAHDRYDCTRTAASSRIGCHFCCSKKIANSQCDRTAMVVRTKR